MWWVSLYAEIKDVRGTRMPCLISTKSMVTVRVSLVILFRDTDARVASRPAVF